MKEYYCKVSDLNEYLLRLDKDLDELKKTLATVPDERNYSLKIKESILVEIGKLEEHRKNLLDTQILINDPMFSLDSKELNLNKVSSDQKKEFQISKPGPKKISKDKNPNNPQKSNQIRRY
jgi:hypothetical protein